MVSRPPDQSDVDDLRAQVEAEPPGETRTILAERLTLMQEYVTDMAAHPIVGNDDVD